MHDWTTIVEARLRELGVAAPPDDMVEELALHLAQVQDEGIAEGLDETAAAARALALLTESSPLLRAVQAKQLPRGNRLAEWAYRNTPGDSAHGGWMSANDVTRDARHALRLLLRTPAFTLIAVLTFAVGIGVNTAVFSVVNGVLLSALPYPEADRITLVWLDNRRQGIKDDITSYPNYRDWRDQNSSYAALAGFTTSSFALTGAGEPERLAGAEATANFFDVMGIAPTLGRVFTAANEVPGKDTVVVLSHGLWQRRFGGTPDVLGKTIALNGTPYEVIGVMPPRMAWPERAELWTPLAPDADLRDARGAFWLPVIGRLKPGVPVEQAQTELAGISARLEEQYPGNRGYGANVVPLKRQIVGNMDRPLLVLMAAVGFVLLIACANLANLMLGRTAARRRELAIRAALGAGRARIVRQIVTEALVLAFVGGAAGVALAYGATRLFLRVGEDSIPRPDAIGLDGRVFGFALVIAVTAALIAALAPAVQASRAAAADGLREGGRQGGSGSSRRTRSALVAAEVALAFVLLTGAGLLVRTLWTMSGMDRGFVAEGVTVGTVSAPATAYPETRDVRGFYARLLERVRSAPGVESAALASGILQPLVTRSGNFTIEGQPVPPPEQRIEYPFESVTPGFFETLSITLSSGRTFTDADVADAPRVVIINETMARLGWPGQDPLGRRIRSGGVNSQSPWMTVVGVIRDVRRGDVTRPIRPELYLCSLQSTPRTQTLVVRAAGDAGSIPGTLRRELQAVDPQLPLYRLGPLDAEIARTLSQPRFQATLLAWFAAIALLLATIGIYGVTSHAVGQRTQEVGIRMALGARRGDVLRMIVTQHLRPALVGLAIGFAGALALGRYVAALLYGVRASDPVTLAVMGVALLAVASFACWIPARRAMRVDPLVALRAE